MVVGLIVGIEQDVKYQSSYQSNYSAQENVQTSDSRSWNYQSTEVYSPTVVMNSPKAIAGTTVMPELTNKIDTAQESAQAHTPTLSAEQAAELGGGNWMMLLVIGAVILAAIFLWRR